MRASKSVTWRWAGSPELKISRVPGSRNSRRAEAARSVTRDSAENPGTSVVAVQDGTFQRTGVNSGPRSFQKEAIALLAGSKLQCLSRKLAIKNGGDRDDAENDDGNNGDA